MSRSIYMESDGVVVEESTPRVCPGVSETARKTASSRRFVSRGRSTTDSIRSSTRSTARQSLLGRPVTARPSRRDARYRRCQVAVYNFLERPKNWRSILYHLLVWVRCCSSAIRMLYMLRLKIFQHKNYDFSTLALKYSHIFDKSSSSSSVYLFNNKTVQIQWQTLIQMKLNREWQGW